MLLLFTYICIALGFSFLCSVAEAVILSVTMPYIALLEQEQEGKGSGTLLRRLKDDINTPLAAILTLNTTAHTIGAAGAGAQAAVVFGNAYVGVASAVLTLLILVFSEIVPKTLGAHYWRQLAPLTAHGLKYLIIMLYPFVKMAEWLTGRIATEPTLRGFSREEFAVMADLGAEEGQLGEKESLILKNLFMFRDMQARDVMTPRSVVFALDETMSVEDFFLKHDSVRFSRIPLYERDREHISGFVLRSDLLLARARGNSENRLANYCRELPVLPDSTSLLHAFDKLLDRRAHILLIVDEYGGMEGVLTLEDILETLLGMEIIDEGDKNVDMRKLARRLWKRRAKAMGLKIS
ncbi:MAG: DUF21 domain-containing protein [gamma proteobacterium endosymbiont of Lamellibrachia anaximandri]|nr:DUF21 domain-containing protein [gamma proteobacterium endosymbiont of Lamellibrachia anaximandri]